MKILKNDMLFFNELKLITLMFILFYDGFWFSLEFIVEFLWLWKVKYSYLLYL